MTRQIPVSRRQRIDTHQASIKQNFFFHFKNAGDHTPIWPPAIFGLLSDANFLFCSSIAASIHFVRPLSLQSLRALSSLSISALIIATSFGVSITRSFTHDRDQSCLNRHFPKLVRPCLVEGEGVYRAGCGTHRFSVFPHKSAAIGWITLVRAFGWDTWKALPASMSRRSSVSLWRG